METHIDTGKSKLTTEVFENKELLDACVLDISGKLISRPEIKVYGKICHQRRDVGFFSNDSIGYRYSGQLARSIPLTDNLEQLLAIVNERYNSNFNGILVNKYHNGLDYIGAHSDDETKLGKNGVVAISYGATRKFRVREKSTKNRIDIPIIAYSIMHMSGNFQKEFTHEIPIEKKVKEARISFTFRHHTE